MMHCLSTELSSAISIQCPQCDILLTGRDQFMGHMIHNHGMNFEGLKEIWQSISITLLNDQKSKRNHGKEERTSQALI